MSKGAKIARQQIETVKTHQKEEGDRELKYNKQFLQENEEKQDGGYQEDVGQRTEKMSRAQKKLALAQKKATDASAKSSKMEKAQKKKELKNVLKRIKQETFGLESVDSNDNSIHSSSQEDSDPLNIKSQQSDKAGSSSNDDESAEEITEGDENFSQLICSTDGLIENEQDAKKILRGQALRVGADIDPPENFQFGNENGDPKLSGKTIDQKKLFQNLKLYKNRIHDMQSNKPNSKHQDEIMNSIETLNYSLFTDLGGTTHIDLNFFKKNGDTIIYPIMSAAAKGSTEMIQLLLLNKCIDIQVTNTEGVNAFWIACLYGHGNAMKILAEAGIDIFCKNKNKVNVLHLAVSRNHINIVEMLLDSDFPLDLETIDGMTAFQLAAYNGHSEIIRIIINYLKKHDNPEFTDLILNKVNPYSNLSTLAYAILNCGDGGAKGDQLSLGKKVSDKKNKPKDSKAADSAEAENLKFAEYLDISKQLIENGAQSYYSETDEQKDFSPIFMAVQKEHQDLLELMCDHGSSLTVKNSVGMTPLMFAAEQNYQIIVNYLSLRTRDLNEEDSNSITILVHQLFSKNMKMASRLIVRGAQIDYVNRNGQTALHLCVENHCADNNLQDAVEFLLFKGANPHIMNLQGLDACDIAKANGLARDIPEFNNCNITKKIIPMLPDGRHADIRDLPVFKKQLQFQHNNKDTHFELQTPYLGPHMNSISSRNSRVNNSSRQNSSNQQSNIRQSKQKLHQSRDQEINRQEEYQPETSGRKTLAKKKLPSPKPIDDVDEQEQYQQDRAADLERLVNSGVEEALNGNSSARKSQKPEKREGQDIVIRQIKEVSSFQIEEMKEIANNLDKNFKEQMQAEKAQRQYEFKNFKREQQSSQQVLLREIKFKKDQKQEAHLQLAPALGQMEYVKEGSENVKGARDKKKLKVNGQTVDSSTGQSEARTAYAELGALKEIKDEILKERLQLERLIIDENEKLMNNGLNSILELNNKLRKLTDQKRQGAKPKPKTKPSALKGHNVALSANGGNVNPPINDLKKKVVKPRSQSSNKHRQQVEEENEVEDEFLNLSEETFENECNFVEQQLVDMEQQINQAISNLKLPDESGEKPKASKNPKKSLQQRSTKSTIMKKNTSKSSPTKQGRL